MMDGLFLLLGSNANGSHGYLEAAQRELGVLLGPTIASSSIYKTEPWGKTDQEWFLNRVLVFPTPDDSPDDLLSSLKDLESKLGRKKTERWGPREIEIDILYWDDMVIHGEKLNIPHTAIQERRFTLEPLVEIAADKIHPLLNKTQKELLTECKDNSKVFRLANS